MHVNDEYVFRTACREGHLEVIKLLLSLEGDQRIDVHAGDDSAFLKACREGQLEVVKLLLSLTGDRRIDVHAAGEYAFRTACNYGRLNIVRLLLDLKGDRKIDVHVHDDSGFQSLCSVCDGEHKKIVHHLLSSGMDRIPSKWVFDSYYHRCHSAYDKDVLTWEDVLSINRFRGPGLLNWRHAYEAHRDARTIYAQARIGRPMELRRRLYLGKFAGGLYIRGKDGLTPREVAISRGNTDCVEIIDEIQAEVQDKYPYLIPPPPPPEPTGCTACVIS